MDEHTLPNDQDVELRELGQTGISVTPVALGCWPIAGVTTRDVNDADSLATIRAAGDRGINCIDTAYVYGPAGESERLVGQAIDGRRDELVIATKGGIHFDENGEMADDGRPETLRRECDESLARMGIDHVELYYLHSPDPAVPVAESAGAIRDLIDAGKVRAAGASNCSLEQIQEFASACPLTAVQLPYNMLQRDIEEQTIPWCRENGVAVAVYWALMKGLLAGKITAAKPLADDDSRRRYPMYVGDELAKNLAFVETLRGIAAESGKTVAQLVINWTMHQPGITTVLCGAKRAYQIEESAGALDWRLSDAQTAAIAAALEARGDAEAKRVFK
ncbi:aldo/keto reductase [Pirellulales bacterium]|nr:aldo/keto reductase [Pirellulales bacterium]